jgi:hypothetical protein
MSVAVIEPEVVEVAKPATAEHWAPLVAADWRASVAAIVATGRRLQEARRACRQGEYLRLFSDHRQPCDGHLLFSSRTGQRLVEIAKNPVLADPSHGSHLPASWRTLAELARVKPKPLLAALQDGRVHPEMERRQAEALVAKRATKATAKPSQAPEELQAPEEVIHAAVKSAVTKTVGKLRTPEQFLRVRRILERMLEYVAERESKQVRGESERASAG